MGISERLEKKKKVAFEISSLSNCPLSCKQEKHLTTPNTPQINLSTEIIISLGL